MEELKKQAVLMFFKDKGDILAEMEREMKKVLAKDHIPFTLPTFKAMQAGIDMFWAAQREDGTSPGGINLATISRMYIDYLVYSEQDKVEKILAEKIK